MNLDIVRLFEEVVQKKGNNTCVKWNDSYLSYSDLNNKSNQLAYLLKTKGVGINDVVGVICSPSIKFLISVIALLKSGATYFYIDPLLPNEKIDSLVKKSSLKCLIYDLKFENKILDNGNVIYIKLDNIDSELENLPTNNIEGIDYSKANAWILQTSGTTGEPNLIIHKHDSCVKSLLYEIKNLDLSDNDIHLLKYLVSHRELFLPLLSGGIAVIANENMQFNLNSVIDFIIKEKITVVSFVPSILKILVSLQEFKLCLNLKHICSGGEGLPFQLVSEILELLKDVKIYDNYSLSEAFYVFAKRYYLKNNIIIREKLNSLGNIIIIDDTENIVRKNHRGEICISGEGLSLGYYNNEELTNKKFIRNYSQNENVLYKTGDWGMFDDDGFLIIEGRKDNQIKIAGNRVELQEIENAILSYKGIIETAIITKKTSSEDISIVAFINKKDLSLTKKDILKYLSKKIPNYMIPSEIHFIENIPKTSMGKINYKYLRDNF